MKKKVLIFIVILVLIITGLGLYLDRVYLPTKAKSMIIEAIEDSLGREVSLGSLRLNILKGIMLDELVIFDEDKESVFLKIKQISFGWLVLPSIKKKQIIIPFVNVNSPVVFLRRNRDGTFNIPALIRKKQDANMEKLSLIVYRVDIKDAEINIRDEKVSPVYSQRFFIDAGLSLSLPKKIKYSLSGNFENFDFSPIHIQSKGEFDLAEKKLISFWEFKDLNLKSFSVYYNDLPLKLEQGVIEEVSIDAILKDNVLDLDLDAKLSSLSVLKEKINYSGSAELDGVIQYNFKTKVFGYSGKLTVDKALITGVPFIEEVEDLSGLVSFSPDNIDVSDIKGKVIGSVFSADAKLRNFKNLYLKAAIQTKSISLGKIKSLLVKNNILDIPLEAEGNVGLSLDLSAHLSKPYDLQLEGEAVLIKNKLKLTKLDKIVEDVVGKISFDKKGLSWDELSFVFNQSKYLSSGKVSGFSSPQIDFSLTSSDLSLTAEMKMTETILTLKSLSGKFADSEFSLDGSVFLNGGGSEFNVNSDLSLELGDLKRISSLYLPQYLPALEKINAQGRCNIKLSAQGRMDDIRAMYLDASLASDLVSIYVSLPDRPGFKLDNLNINLKQENMKVSSLRFFSNFYNGRIKLIADADLTYARPLFRANLELVDSDLALLKLDTPLRTKNLSGLINASLVLNGQGNDLFELKGEGRISIKDGVLWELEPLKKLAQFLVILSFDKIVFNEAEADLLIKDGNIFSEEIVMRSPQMSLHARGKIDFDGNLDYTVRSESSKDIDEAIKDSPLGILSSVLTKASEFVTVKVTGTIKDPEYRTLSTTVESLKEINPLEILRDQLKGIFE